MTFLKLTQGDLMEAFGVATRGAVGHYLNRRRSPSPEQLIALADVLRMTVGELMAGEAVAVTPEEDQRRLHEFRASENLRPETVRLTVAALKDAFAARGERFDIEVNADLFCLLYTVMEKQAHDAHPDDVRDLALALADMNLGRKRASGLERNADPRGFKKAGK